jgi:two-component system, cell cycle sensor histidine kinase and response regulator CckA
VEVSVQSGLGETGQMFAFLRDITNRKQAERQLQYSHDLLEYIITHARSAIAVHDRDLRYVYVSKRYLSEYGIKEANVIGKHHYEVFPDLPQKWRDVHQRSLKGEVLSAEEDAYARENGSVVWTRWECRPWFQAEGVIGGIIIYTEVITERKALEAQLLQAQKLESIGQLAGGVAHDFNNILAATMMHLNLLQRKNNLDAETREALVELMEEARRAANLTRQLLAFSRRSVLEVKLLDLNELVADLLKMLGRLIGEDIHIRFDRSGSTPLVEADAGMLEQVLLNLAVNARDAMPRGGRLTIAVEPISINSVRGRLAADARVGCFICLSVADTGCGMDEATVKRIFEPFFTTKEVGKGTGLGLATVHGIVGQHKGWLEVESSVGCGSIFRVFLPAAEERRLEPVKCEPTELPKGKETILLVEDEATVRKASAQGLRLLGYMVLEAANGKEAMLRWQENGPAIDLLFTDMVMPEGMTGLDGAERLRMEKRGLPVIIVSGYNAEITKPAQLDAQGIMYLQKPFQLEAMAKAVRDCFTKR